MENLTHNVQYVPDALCPLCGVQMLAMNGYGRGDFIQCLAPGCKNKDKYRIPTMNLEIIQNDDPR